MTLTLTTGETQTAFKVFLDALREETDILELAKTSDDLANSLLRIGDLLDPWHKAFGKGRIE